MEVTWRRVCGGHYVDDATGVEIKRFSTRFWQVLQPVREGVRPATTPIRTLGEAKTAAQKNAVPAMLREIAAAFTTATRPVHRDVAPAGAVEPSVTPVSGGVLWTAVKVDGMPAYRDEVSGVTVVQEQTRWWRVLTPSFSPKGKPRGAGRWRHVADARRAATERIIPAIRVTMGRIHAEALVENDRRTYVGGSDQIEKMYEQHDADIAQKARRDLLLEILQESQGYTLAPIDVRAIAKRHRIDLGAQRTPPKFLAYKESEPAIAVTLE